ncbi:MAG: hypothetical protein R2851_23745 [Caldilineaceae bacterium]
MNHRYKSILIGVLSGALLGAAFAWVASDGGDAEGDEHLGLTALGPGDYIALGISILTLARQFSGMIKRT